MFLFQDKKKYLDTIHNYMEVHGTVHGTSTVHVPSYVKNHGILSGRDLQFLLRETKASPPCSSGAHENNLKIWAGVEAAVCLTPREEQLFDVECTHRTREMQLTSMVF